MWSLQNSQNDWFFLNLSKCHLVTAEVSRKFCTYLGSFSLKRDRFVGTYCTTLVDEFKGPCTSRTQQATVCSNTTTRWRFNYYNSALNMHTIVDFMEITSYLMNRTAWTQLLRTFVTIVYPYNKLSFNSRFTCLLVRLGHWVDIFLKSTAVYIRVANVVADHDNLLTQWRLI